MQTAMEGLQGREDSLAPTNRIAFEAISMQMQCRSNQGLPNKCIRIAVRFAAAATNLGTNPIKDRTLLTRSQSVANNIAVCITLGFGPRDVEA